MAGIRACGDAPLDDAEAMRPRWCCPACKAAPSETSGGLSCPSCGAHYPCIGGIPDLRLPGPSWIDYSEDRARAERLLLETAGSPLNEIIQGIFADREGVDPAWVELRTRQVLGAPERLRSEVRGWLQPIIGIGGPFLDLGCGAGTLLAAAAAEGRPGIGIDVSMVWLIVARRMIQEAGGRPILAAALAEALPLPDGSMAAVVSLDVIEHVADPVPYLREIDRVTRCRGRLALATPNRFSLAAEPHVMVWGVGWLPRRWQATYVRWKARRSYAYTTLLSTMEARRLLRRHTRFAARITIPPVPLVEIERFSRRRAWLARLYNQVANFALLRPLFLLIAPFFRVTCTKAGSKLDDDTGARRLSRSEGLVQALRLLTNLRAANAVRLLEVFLPPPGPHLCGHRCRRRRRPPARPAARPAQRRKPCLGAEDPQVAE